MPLAFVIALPLPRVRVIQSDLNLSKVQILARRPDRFASLAHWNAFADD
jgi:hypothetical protein